MISLFLPTQIVGFLGLLVKLTSMHSSGHGTSRNHEPRQSFGFEVLTRDVRRLIGDLSHSPSVAHALAPFFASASDETLANLTKQLESHWAHRLAERQAYYAAAASGLCGGLLIPLASPGYLTLKNPSITALILFTCFLVFMIVLRAAISRTGVLAIKRDLETLGDLSLLNILMRQELRKNGPATQYIAHVNGKCKRKLRVIDAKIALALNDRPIRKMRSVKKREVLRKMLGRGSADFVED